jgi:hypothetical protein
MADDQIPLPDSELYKEDYEPHFNRLGIHRRVLGHITDSEHVGRGPRNTLDRLVVEVAEDPFSNYDGNRNEMAHFLDELTKAGLIGQRADETYMITAAGRVELAN